MEKYICTICEYVYDPEQGDPENGSRTGEHPLRTSLPIGFAPCAE